MGFRGRLASVRREDGEASGEAQKRKFPVAGEDARTKSKGFVGDGAHCVRPCGFRGIAAYFLFREIDEYFVNEYSLLRAPFRFFVCRESFFPA